jgi:hypothetical protein
MDFLFWIISIINIIALKNIYWPVLKNHVDGMIALESLLKSWQLVFTTYTAFSIILLKQWWFRTAISLGEDRYIISHILNGKVVKFLIKPIDAKNKIKAVVNENYNECYLEESEPFFRYEMEKFCPEAIGLNKPLFIHVCGKDDDVIHHLPTTMESNRKNN